MAGPVNLVTNGDFSETSYTQNHQFGSAWGGQGVTGWTGNGGYNIFYFGGTANTVSARNQWGSPYDKLSTNSSPTGGNFVALDGDIGVRGGISQMISGLVVGTRYTLSFSWAADQLLSRTGDTTEQLQISLGDETYTTEVVNNLSHSTTGWFDEIFTFTATSTSELLSFLSIGTPSGLPPIALLADISLFADSNAVPEPASWLLVGLGLGIAGLVRRRHRIAA